MRLSRRDRRLRAGRFPGSSPPESGGNIVVRHREKALCKVENFRQSKILTVSTIPTSLLVMTARAPPTSRSHPTIHHMMAEWETLGRRAAKTANRSSRQRPVGQFSVQTNGFFGPDDWHDHPARDHDDTRCARTHHVSWRAPHTFRIGRPSKHPRAGVASFRPPPKTACTVGTTPCAVVR